MAIRIARCIRCQADAIVYGPGATLLDVKPGELVHIGFHRDGDGDSCSGFTGRMHPDYPICQGCGEEIVDGGSDLFHEGCERTCAECDSPSHTEFEHERP